MIRVQESPLPQAFDGCGYCGQDVPVVAVVYGQPMRLAMTEADGSRSIRVVPVKAVGA